MGVLKAFLYGIYVIVCLLLITIVLLQRGSEEELGGAFGGMGGGAENLLGARGDITLKKITAVFAAIFFLFSILIGVLELNTKVKSITTEKKSPPAKQKKSAVKTISKHYFS